MSHEDELHGQGDLCLTESEINCTKNEELKIIAPLKLTASLFVKKLITNNETNHLTNQKTFFETLSERLNGTIYSSETDLKKKCKQIALSPEWILSKKDVYPWSHPKNIRYIEKYKQQKILSNGNLLVKPIVKMGMDSISKHDGEKEKVSCQKRKVDVSRSETSNKIDGRVKKRKQKRARGVKKRANIQISGSQDI